MKTKNPIGQLKSKATVYCTLCACSQKRSLKANIYENTPEKIQEAKEELKAKASKKYTCRICKSILKDAK